MEGATTFCCVQCRLLQPPTAACAECGSPMTAPVELVRELLYYRDMNMVRGRDWAFLTALLAGSTIAFPVLAPAALGSLVALGVHKVRGLRRLRAIAGVALAPAEAPQGATTWIGTARRFRASVPSLAGDAPVLHEHAAVIDRRGDVLFRRSSGAPFLLDTDEGEQVLVTGVTRLVASRAAVVARVKRGDARLRRMGVPDDLAIAGRLEISSVTEARPTFAVTGIVEDEAVAELAFHRDGGQIAVMRGTLGAPVLVEQLG